ncbi:helix-turn-helix transcriptional regulator [Arthrobacter zhaoguopingii]|uniref:helix-turn-helix transcriptional regulator n=1 Tax=Arthrobacter zhaoguopingii TaxID=2681491 RepID=UPI00135B6BB5|nr:helix-turn-helix transcriptional regulator [Arthrobacter zhaoguopingii]
MFGQFLQARRAAITPEEVGLPTSSGRRVSGLRREEVAALAGMSVDYYTRLEQGRERHPSVQVVEALARTLRFDEDARLHAYRLAGMLPAPVLGPSTESAAPELTELLRMWPKTPAIVFGRAYDVLSANSLAIALFDPFDLHGNLILSVFLDPGARVFYKEWDMVARSSAGALRLAQGAAPDDRRVTEVIESLLRHSPAFGELWSSHEVRGKTLESKHLRHRNVGELVLRMQTFDVRSAPGQQLVIYHAERGSPSADALALLGVLTASPSPEKADRTG